MNEQHQRPTPGPKPNSINPHPKTASFRKGRQWRITSSTIFNVEYQRQSARVEALISPLLEDEIFLIWTTLRDLISGPVYGNQFPTPNAKKRLTNNLEPESLHNHVNTTRVAGTPYNTPNKPCQGCGEDRLPHYRET